MKFVPTYGTIKNVVKYHHEHIDGSGSFGKSADETPLYAKIIHLADQIDVQFDFSSINEEKIQKMTTYLERNKGTIYCTNIVDVFIKYANINMFHSLSDENLDDFMLNMIPESIREFDMETIIHFVDVFVKIIDYKSEFTQLHTSQLTKKAMIMSEYYGFDETTKIKFYMAAGLHDIGKLTVSSSILEKPDKLTVDEFEHIKTHAYYTHQILSKIKHIDDIVDWASLHHEKLDGSGYPFGKTAEELDDKCRLMACLDIYQALREERPYKAGLTHEKSISILKKMVSEKLIDGNIIKDLTIAFGTNNG